jgi:hypothetical protein
MPDIKDIKDIKEIDIESKEGKLLVAALAVLTTMRTNDLVENKWGRTLNANMVLNKLSEITNKMFAKKHRTEGIAREKIRRALNK